MGKWNVSDQMTRKEKIEDLLFFKVKSNNLDLKIEPSTKVEKGNIFNLVISINR